MSVLFSLTPKAASKVDTVSIFVFTKHFPSLIGQLAETVDQLSPVAKVKILALRSDILVAEPVE